MRVRASPLDRDATPQAILPQQLRDKDHVRETRARELHRARARGRPCLPSPYAWLPPAGRGTGGRTASTPSAKPILQQLQSAATVRPVDSMPGFRLSPEAIGNYGGPAQKFQASLALRRRLDGVVGISRPLGVQDDDDRDDRSPIGTALDQGVRLVEFLEQ